jgi:hypothetical protein
MPFAGYGPQEPQPEEPSGRGRIAIANLIIVALILALVVASAAMLLTSHRSPGAPVAYATHTPAPAATPTITPTPAPTVPAGFRAFQDPAGNYQFDVPENWISISQLPVMFAAPDHSAIFAIASDNKTYTGQEIADNENAFFASMSQSAGGSGSYWNVQGPAQIALAGETWTKESATVSIQGGSVQAVVLMANHGANAFLIGYYATPSSFSGNDTRTFQPMLATFEFLT